MSKLPRITVITPSFNQAAFLPRTIESVLGQKYPNLEYFVIDGGSTDGSADVIRCYASQLNGWVSKRDRGQADAINQGLSWANGEIIAFLNSDDTYPAGTLRRVAERMAGEKAPRWLVGACAMIDTDDVVLDRFAHHAPESYLQYLMHTSGMIPQPSSFWNADLFRRNGYFDAGLHYCFDYEFHCRLMANGETPTLIDDTLAHFRVHPTSKGCSQPIKFGLERLTVAARYAKHLPINQRYLLWRNIGYRRRRYAIQLASRQGAPPLWAQVLRKPWWLLSEEIREALFAPSTELRRAG